MNTVQVLPDNYREICSIDLQKNKREAIIVNVIAGIITLAMYIIMGHRSCAQSRADFRPGHGAVSGYSQLLHSRTEPALAQDVQTSYIIRCDQKGRRDIESSQARVHR